MTTNFHVSCDDCPFERTYSSQARADYFFGRHSCERQNRMAQLRARGEARKAGVDRTPKSCHHKQVTHVHGTRACYVLDKCRCERCAPAHSAYEKDRTRQHAYGRWGNLVDARPGREHIKQLMAQGMGLKRIVAVGGVSQGSLWKLIYGKRRPDGSRVPSKRITADLERRILAVELDLADGARVDSTGAVRRVQALVAIGWSLTKIADRLDIRRSNFTDIPNGLRTQVNVAHDRAIRALYDEWSMRLPQQAVWHDKAAASRARRYAQQRGWQPPLAWDEETIDDPAATPAEVVAGVHVDDAAVERRMAGDKTVALTSADRGELVRRMLARGFSFNEIERRTGVNPRRQYATPEGVSA